MDLWIECCSASNIILSLLGSQYLKCPIFVTLLKMIFIKMPLSRRFVQHSNYVGKVWQNTWIYLHNLDRNHFKFALPWKSRTSVIHLPGRTTTTCRYCFSVRYMLKSLWRNGIVAPYGILYLSLHWFRQQLLAWRSVALFFLYPPNNEVVGGYIGFTLSVRLSVRPSRLPCPLCNIYSSGWILSILATNDHYHERVCRTQWPLTLTYIFKVIRPWLRKSCPLCSVYSSGWIIFIFSTNTNYYSRVCRVLRVSQNLKIWIFNKFLKFFGLARWILSIFSTNDH